MDGIGGLGSTYSQDDPYAAFKLGGGMSTFKQFSEDLASEGSFASVSANALGGLRNYVEGQLVMGMGQKEEMDVQGAAELASALGAEMSNHTDMAAIAQMHVNPDRAVVLLR